ncbi:MAG: hypothetical protein MMC33_001367 [Icmadophila ericetorum]|nr:hypothetical protein [Icmadophila ericetorum]
MASRLMLRKRTLLPASAGLFAAGTLLYPRNTVHAESPPASIISRKPIYDDPSLPPPPKQKYTPSNPDTPDLSDVPSSSSPTPTDRLAAQIRTARLFLHSQSSTVETRFNDLMTSILHIENSFTSTIASLAPDPATGERLLPGGLYVFVAAMAGSIISRNRNILLRASTPLAAGITAGWILLPNTMRNVSELVWTFEERAPVVAENHLRVKGTVVEGARQVRVHTRLASAWAEERVRQGREAVEGWVKKGK